MTDTPIRVFMLDDHEIVRRGIADLLDAADDISVVGEAATAAEALARIPAARPDVAVLDARLPDGSGIDVCRDIRSALPEIRCLIRHEAVPRIEGSDLRYPDLGHLAAVDLGGGKRAGWSGGHAPARRDRRRSSPPRRRARRTRARPPSTGKWDRSPWR